MNVVRGKSKRRAKAEHGLLGQEMEFRVNIIDEGIRPRDIVIGNVVPELDQINSSVGTLEDDGKRRSASK
jgi:hypothetical protein